MAISTITSPVISHTTFEQARGQNVPSENIGLQQVSSPNNPLSSSRSELNLTLSTQTKAELTQLKADKLSLSSIDDKPLIDNIKKTLVADAALANFPYSHDLAELKSAKAGNWGAEFGPLIQSIQVGGEQNNIGDNGIVTKSGLTAFIFADETTKEVRLVFGGTTSGEVAGDLNTRTKGNLLTTAKQWLANIKNVFSGTPDSYKEAAKLTAEVKKLLPDEYKLSLSGHSKGGGESAYAAMMLAAKTGEPVKSINFSSAELGSKLKQNIANELLKSGTPQGELGDKLKSLSQNMLHVKVKGDPVPNMHKMFGNVSHLGKTLTVPNDSQSTAHLSEHVDFFNRIASWAMTGSMTHHADISGPRSYV